MANPEATKSAAGKQPAAPDMDILTSTVTIHPPLVPEQPVAPSAGLDTLPTAQSTSLEFRDAPFEFLREISRHYSGSGWRAYDNPIGQPVFYPGFTENMKNRVLNSELLKQRILDLATKRVEVELKEGLLSGGIEKIKGEEAQAKEIANRKKRRLRELIVSLNEVAARDVDGMICKFESKRFIRAAYYIAMQILARTYHQGVHVSTEEVLRLRRIAQIAAEKKQSLIFLPCHRSHIDYVSLQLICYQLGIVLPTVVAGDNLNFPVVGQFLQHAGAFYIRRSFSRDSLYGSVVQAYIDALLSEGFNFECFIEGGRSRTGKLLPPKFGILNFILDSLLSERVSDSYIIPVSTQYDKVIETEAYVNELLGIPKRKENLIDFISSSKVLSLKMGRVDVRFGRPWSLREFINTQIAKEPNADMAEGGAGRLRLLRTLGYKVLADINAVSVVMPTSLIGTILLTLRGRGVGKRELVRRIEWLSERIRAKGGRVADFGGIGTETVVERGLEVLGELVGRVEGLAEETFYAVDRFQLSFYRNMVIHLFISEAIVAAAMYTRIKQGGAPPNQVIRYAALLDQVVFLSSLFRGEFVFPPEGVRANLHRTISGLEADGVITVEREGDQVLSVELSKQERDQGRENYDFYCFLIWPFIEGSWLAGVAIIGLTPPAAKEGEGGGEAGREWNPWVPVKAAQEMAQLLGKTLYHQGDLSYFEAVNKQTMANSFLRFEEEGIILVRKPIPAPTAPVCRLAPEWVPKRDQKTGKLIPEGRLWDFVEKIAKSRREGKNRRDGATVSRRVLVLVGELGEELFRMHAGEGGMVRGGDERVSGEGVGEGGAEKGKGKGRRGLARL
ncbi:putative acyltransferase [Kalaharituber pfeilii]|nr:putative acyltransferase [Kalaharituber pfeilii]